MHIVSLHCLSSAGWRERGEWGGGRVLVVGSQDFDVDGQDFAVDVVAQDLGLGLRPSAFGTMKCYTNANPRVWPRNSDHCCNSDHCWTSQQ